MLLQHGTDDPMVPVAGTRDLAEVLAEAGLPVVFAEYPMGHEVALESVQQAQGWLDAVRAGERPSEPLPEPPPEGLVKAVTTATFPTEVLGADVPVIVDFWAPVVRAVPPGRADRRADRGDAPGLLQGREGQHRRGAVAGAGVRRAEHPAHRPVPERPPRARRRSGPSPARSSRPSWGCSSSPDRDRCRPSRPGSDRSPPTTACRARRARARGRRPRRARPRTAGRPRSARRRAAAARRVRARSKSTESSTNAWLRCVPPGDHAVGEQRAHAVDHRHRAGVDVGREPGTRRAARAGGRGVRSR